MNKKYASMFMHLPSAPVYTACSTWGPQHPGQGSQNGFSWHSMSFTMAMYSRCVQQHSLANVFTNTP